MDSKTIIAVATKRRAIEEASHTQFITIPDKANTRSCNRRTREEDLREQPQSGPRDFHISRSESPGNFLL
jgi:hypothetical protein